jgi:hypothetical protein
VRGVTCPRRPHSSACPAAAPVIYCRMTLIVSVYITNGLGKPVEDEALAGSLATTTWIARRSRLVLAPSYLLVMCGLTWEAASCAAAAPAPVGFICWRSDE